MRCCVTLLLTVALIGKAQAEPGPIVTTLMGQEASRFSFGMYRLDLTLRSAANDIDKEGWATYEWNENRIQLNLKFDTADPSDLKGQCQKAVNEVKFWGGVLGNGKTFSGTSSLYSTAFSDFGFTRKLDPDDIYIKIDQIIEVLAEVTYAGDKFIRCRSPLLSPAIYFEGE